jgi:pyruvate/2-oxoglutarate dehydrogenase complex dihydrolipoamide dehydrogenase (E3) component
VDGVKVDFPAVMARVQRAIDEGVSFYEHQVERDEGITLFRGHARFVDEHRIECNGRTVEFANALIATGARPRVPDLPGLDHVPFATSDDLLRASECHATSSASGRGRSRWSSRRSTGGSAPK